MTGRQTRGEATIERVLDATLACAVESGIHDVSIEAVCKRSKVSVGSLYHHFPDRHGLVFALYRRCLESMLEATVRATVVHRDPETGVKALVSAYLRWVETHRDEARIIYGVAEGDLLESYRDELAALGARVVRPLVEWLAPFVASRHIIAMSPALLEVVLIGQPPKLPRRIPVVHWALVSATHARCCPKSRGAWSLRRKLSLSANAFHLVRIARGRKPVQNPTPVLRKRCRNAGR